MSRPGNIIYGGTNLGQKEEEQYASARMVLEILHFLEEQFSEETLNIPAQGKKKGKVVLLIFLHLFGASLFLLVPIVSKPRKGL